MAQHDPIIEKIEGFISKYLAMPKDELRIVALWVLHSWQFSESVSPNPPTTPYLYIHSAQKGSGKSLLGIDILGLLARNAQPVANITPATLFALTDSVATLLIDEVDTIYSGAKNEDLRGVLNVGYRKGAKVPRKQGKEVRLYDVFTPKVLIGIDNANLPDTIRDRCIPIHMHRATEDEMKTLTEFLIFEVVDDAEELAEALFQWTQDHREAGRYRPQRIDGLSPRQWEICYPLLQVAHAAGSESAARKSLSKVMKQREERLTPEQEILKSIRETFDKAGKPRLTTRELMLPLNDDPRFASLNGVGLAAKLRPFDIFPQTLRFGNTTHKGYKRDDFEDAWSRYL